MGILFINKKPGITSFDALGEIKRALGTGKVGHTGTLD
jgi:tRNA pseudouridine55 synthase